MLKHHWTRRWIMLVLVAAVALAAPVAAEAAKRAKGAPKVTVMTRNLFLGADLAPAIEAPDIPSAIDGAGTVWNELQSTKFPERAAPLAREIKRSADRQSQKRRVRNATDIACRLLHGLTSCCGTGSSKP